MKQVLIFLITVFMDVDLMNFFHLRCQLMFAVVSMFIVSCNLFTSINHKVCNINSLNALFLKFF